MKFSLRAQTVWKKLSNCEPVYINVLCRMMAFQRPFVTTVLTDNTVPYPCPSRFRVKCSYHNTAEGSKQMAGCGDWRGLLSVNVSLANLNLQELQQKKPDESSTLHQILVVLLQSSFSSIFPGRQLPAQVRSTPYPWKGSGSCLQPLYAYSLLY